ncbi:MAG: hypothetical protein AAB305_03805 [Candidatus Zixiibacteriota bacterium]
MKRTVLLLMTLLVGVILPLQTTQSRTTPWEKDPWNADPGEDHPWGGDITDPGGVRIQPGGDYGYIQMSIIGRIVGYTMPIILRLYTKGQATPVPVTRTITRVAPSNTTPSRTILMSGGK